MAEEKQETALVPKQQSDIMKPNAQAGKLSRLAAFTPVNLTEAIALSKLIANSELAPKDFKGKPANVLIAMQMGAEVGLAPMASLQNIAVINGRPSLWGDAALGVVQVHPEYEWHKEWMEGQGNARVAMFEIKRKGQEPYRTKFSVAMAIEAKLWQKRGREGQDTPWITHPERMLQMRARGFGLRDKFADALRGLSIAEEAMDITPDTSEVKRKREEGTLDVTGLNSLTPSAEPNRGHNDTGLGKTDEQKQPDPKPDKIMCNECRQIDSHLETCSEFVKAQQDAKTSQPTRKESVLILKIRKMRKKEGNKEPYLILDAVDEGNHEYSYFVWHHSFFPFLDGIVDKKCTFEVSLKGKFLTVEHLLEVAGVPFVNDKPAEQATMPAEREPGSDDDAW
jgi:hypothetical protein